MTAKRWANPSCRNGKNQPPPARLTKGKARERHRLAQVRQTAVASGPRAAPAFAAPSAKPDAARARQRAAWGRPGA